MYICLWRIAAFIGNVGIYLKLCMMIFVTTKRSNSVTVIIKSVFTFKHADFELFDNCLYDIILLII